MESYRGRTLVRIHERIVRNLFSKYDRINCPFKNNKLLKLPDIYRSQACIHMYKAINLDTNESVAETLALQTANLQYETRNRNLFLVRNYGCVILMVFSVSCQKQKSLPLIPKSGCNKIKLSLPISKYME